MSGGLTNLYSQGLSYGRGLTTLPFVLEPDSTTFVGRGLLTASAIMLSVMSLPTFGGFGGIQATSTLDLASAGAFNGDSDFSIDATVV